MVDSKVFTATPSIVESSAADVFWSAVAALVAAVALDMTRRALTATLDAAAVTTTSMASVKMPTSLVRSVAASKEATSPEAVKRKVTTER